MDDIWKEFWIRILFVLIGVLIAIVATTIVTMTFENGEYAKISVRRMWGIRLLGGMTALAAGLGVLNTNQETNILKLVPLLWLTQVGLGGLGGDGWRRLQRYLKPESPPTPSAQNGEIK